MAITSSFSSNGVLTEFGDAAANTIVTSRNAAGNILVNGGAVTTVGGTPTVANTTLIQVFGQSGNDTITLSEVNGALPAANLFGGDGNDILTGGSGNDQLFGQAGNDTLLGKGGSDTLFGGDDNDTLTGGDGDDQMFGEAGNDRMIWNPGDDNDLMEGGAGTDTAEVNGGNGAEQFTLTANGTRVRFDRVTPAPFFLDIGTTENIVVNMNGGDDVFTAGNGLASLISVTVDGGTGNDTITGGDGADRLLGGDGNDLITGGRGNDTLFGGTGDDTFVWNPGDGSDIIEGQSGVDKLLFNGANINEKIDISANGGRVRFTRDVAAIAMDLDDVENIQFNALGGADTITVNDLTGTDVTQVNLDLGVNGAGDGSADTVIINATAGNDVIRISSVNGVVTVTGLSETVTIAHVDVNDRIVIKGLGGDDIIDTSGLEAGILLTADGGDGNDILIGGQGAVTLLGGNGNDVLLGGSGQNILDGGPGANVVIPGIVPASGGILSVSGDNAGNSLTFSRDAAGRILVNGGAVATQGTPTVANTNLIQVFGQGGNDTITLSEVNGALPAANLFGGDGNDILTGGSGNDLLFGQAGNDILLGKGGTDFLFGGDGDDTLTGGVGDDQMFGEAGNDRMIWNPGEGTDLMEGGDGTDTAEVNGGNGVEQFTLTANGTRVRFDRITPAPFSLDIGTTENIVVNMNGGDDVFTAGTGLASLISLTVDGGTGNDTITGGDGNDKLLGGDGNDRITGGRGNDTLFGGAGDDTFVWNPGDGSDTIEGQDGVDTMVFNGANIAEKIDITANGGRVRFTRDIAAITMDVNDVERINFTALGGADTVTVGDLKGTDVTQVNLDLSSAPGTGAGDGAADNVTVTGTGGNDQIQLTAAGSSVTVTGLAAQIAITGAEGANDVLRVNAGNGNDTINAGTVATGSIGLVLDGGAGNDTITGSQGADTLIGGTGNDTVIGGLGNDFADLGDGTDTFIWNPGEGSDTVEGGTGTDTLLFNGANINENFVISANGSRARLSRDIGSVVMDINGLERIQLNAQGGADTVTVSDLTGTGVTQVAIDLGVNGAGDGAVDTVNIIGAAGNDTIKVSNNNGVITVAGLAETVTISNFDANDQLVINGLTGNDTIDASTLRPNLLKVTLNGGDGDDLIVGSLGDDLVIGGRGNDNLFGNSGNDTFVWNPGDGSDIIEGQGGSDTLQFNGANIAEKIDISANGSRVRFTRDVAAITMDVNGVETINFTALGGSDNITVGDLKGTNTTQVNLDLSGIPGSGTGDGAFDHVTATGTGGNDQIQVVAAGSSVSVLGLAAQVAVSGAESTDVLTVSGGAGNDTINASAAQAGSMSLVLDGGDGNDTITGGSGNDMLLGGAGNDILRGGVGDDQMFGEAGNDRMIWNPGEGTDLMEGGDGTDTAEVNGGNGVEQFTLTANGTRVRFDRITPAPFSLDIGTTENIVVNMNGGDDVFTAGNGLASLISLTVDGGTGNDTITGGDGNDKLLGGDGNDRITGGRGNDTLFGGAGDDTFVWNPGDGSDTIEGQDGVDTMVFNGANIAEKIDITANGGRVRFTRDIAAITMDVNDVERINFTALGGADTVTVGDLKGTDVTQVNLDLSSAPGTGAGDGAADNVTVTGTAGNDQIQLTAAGSSITVTGLAAQVAITGAEGANDVLRVNAGNGDDTINVNTGPTGTMGLVLDGGAGTDTLVLNGANVAENIVISANGTRALLSRDFGNVSMDLNGVEHIQLNALGSADTITVGDLTGTGITQVTIDLGAADGAADTVVVNGTAGNNAISVVKSGSSLVVMGLAEQLTIANFEAGDALVINGLAGNDTIDASSIQAGQARLTLNGGDGDDLIVGSQGDDLVNGARGNDTFVWNPGDGSDIVEGQAGTDTMLFNGANIDEKIDISANGGRVRFTRDIANITMDLNDVENIQFNTLGGVDTITVNDLTGTDVKQVNLDLGVNGAGDGSADTVIINATNGADAIFVSSSNGVVTVTGLSETVTISNFDANDRIVINGLGGDDFIEATGLAVGTLTADGGDGDDVIVGGHVVGILRGGAGDDVIIGGTTQDILDGGTGNNVVIPGTFRPASAALLGQFMASTFVPEGNGVVATIDPQVNQPNMLAAPQHA